LLNADVTMDISRFLAEQLAAAEADVRFILPHASRCAGGYPEWMHAFKVFVHQGISSDNKLRRLSFDATEMHGMLKGVDLFITHNELMAYNVRQLLGDKLKIIHFNHLMPLGDWAWMEPLQQAAWAAADLVVFLAGNLLRFAQQRISQLALWNYQEIKWTLWPMVYDRRPIVFREPSWPAKVDLLFVQRCSASNYTHHREFIEAIKILRIEQSWQGRVVFTDPTGYLEQQGRHELNGLDLAALNIEYAHCQSRDAYYKLLGDSKVAVAMMTDDLHGGVAIREAIASGCIPVLLDQPAYREMLRPYDTSWPWFVQHTLSPRVLAGVLTDVLAKQAVWQFNTLHDQVLGSVRQKLQGETYQAAWTNSAWPDIQGLMHGGTV
jgi:hypothetical protein